MTRKTLIFLFLISQFIYCQDSLNLKEINAFDINDFNTFLSSEDIIFKKFKCNIPLNKDATVNSRMFYNEISLDDNFNIYKDGFEESNCKKESESEIYFIARITENKKIKVNIIWKNSCSSIRFIKIFDKLDELLQNEKSDSSVEFYDFEDDYEQNKNRIRFNLKYHPSRIYFHEIDLMFWHHFSNHDIKKIEHDKNDLDSVIIILELFY